MTGVFENRIISYRSYPYRVRNSVFIVLYILLVMIRSISFFFCEAIKMNWIGISKPTQRTHKSSKRNSKHWYVKYVEQYATRMMSSITIESVKRNQAKKKIDPICTLLNSLNSQQIELIRYFNWQWNNHRGCFSWAVAKQPLL